MSKTNEKQKWPADKSKYDKNWIIIFGKLCPTCKGKDKNACSRCMGLGKVEK